MICQKLSEGGGWGGGGGGWGGGGANLGQSLFLRCRFYIFQITCVKAFAFQSPNIGPFEAQYKRQSLLYEI